MGLSTSVITNGLSSLLNKSFTSHPSVPPPPPPPGLAPPPPAPGAPAPPSMFGYPGSAQRNHVPKPKQPLKSFNWIKLEDSKIKGSIWNDIDDASLYPLLDLEDFEKTFSAYQKKQDEADDSRNSGKCPLKMKELSVIDGRRAQNCTILLSKLKISNEELKAAVLNMDEHEDIPKDMLEQLLRYIPTSEEMQLFSDLGAETQHLARADRFLFEMGKLTHYEQRVKALYFKKKYQDRMSEVKQRIQSVFECSKQLTRSRRMKKLLGIVLAFGNYMNRGQRANARGFAITSLNNMVDTKSSLNKQITLLHYLVDTIEKRFPDVLKIDQDLSFVGQAAKVNFTELEKELATLRTGLKEIGKELVYFQEQMITDRFVTVMSQFATVATYNFSEVEESYTEMKQKVEMCQKCFGIADSNALQPDEFFGVIDSFLTALNSARAENEQMRKQKEEDEKKSQLEEKLRKEREERALKRAGSSVTVDSNSKVYNGSAKGEFDDLVSALRTGDIFGDDIAKLKRNRKRISSQVNTSRERIN